MLRLMHLRLVSDTFGLAVRVCELADRPPLGRRNSCACGFHSVQLRKMSGKSVTTQLANASFTHVVNELFADV